MITYCYKFDPDVFNTFSMIWVWKIKILQRMYEVISAFATQTFRSFWKLISPFILNAKSWLFRRLSSFTRSLKAGAILYMSWSSYDVKSYAINEAKCKKWRQQRSSFCQELVLLTMFKGFYVPIYNFLIQESRSLSNKISKQIKGRGQLPI